MMLQVLELTKGRKQGPRLSSKERFPPSMTTESTALLQIPWKRRQVVSAELWSTLIFFSEIRAHLSGLIEQSCNSLQ